MASLNEKYQSLQNQIKELGRLVIAYSGGIDSTLVLKTAHDMLGGKVLAVTADSPSVPRSELTEAKRIAQMLGARHQIITTEELDNPDYNSNPANRCFFCKFELYTKLINLAKLENTAYIANGTNLDDLGDYRPGLQAAHEFQILSPLRDAGLTKADVRLLAKQLGLPIWDKPASPCLASRIPYGSAVTTEKLASIERAEAFLKTFGIRDLRVRHFGEKARVEVGAQDIGKISSNLNGIREKFSDLGFVEIELSEFRSGALNADLKHLLSHVPSKT